MNNNNILPLYTAIINKHALEKKTTHPENVAKNYRYIFNVFLL